MLTSGTIRDRSVSGGKIYPAGSNNWRFEAGAHRCCSPPRDFGDLQVEGTERGGSRFILRYIEAECLLLSIATDKERIVKSE